MSRRHAAEKREVLPDAKYGDLVLTKFMNNLMLDGKKSVAERIVYNALDRVEDKIKRAPIEVFHEALENIKPSVEVRSRRVGGATYQVPVEVRPERREALAIRWLITAAERATKTQWKSVLLANCWMLCNPVVPPSKSAKTPTRWPTQTKRSAIIAGNPTEAEQIWHANIH